MEIRNQDEERYFIAKKRVERIKGFYIHTFVYVFVNAFIILLSYVHTQHSEKDFFNWDTFSTALFWGIGLTAHGLSVFGRNLFFGENWEERKINEFMEKEKNEKWE